MTPLRVVVADDHPAVRADFVTLLSGAPDLAVVGAAADGHAAVDLTTRLRPDVVVMDVRMPGADGLTALREINRRLGPAAPAVLVVTTFELDEYVFGALRASAAGFLLKADAAVDLPGAVRTVARGDGVVSPSVTRRLISAFAHPAGDPAASRVVAELTAREREVLVLVARGAVNEQIAAELVVGLPTVKTHVRSIFAKLGVTTRTQAVILAYESGLVRPGQDQPWG